MWRLVVGALRARRGQSAVLFLLAVLAVAASTATPLYADAAARAARLDEVRAATGGDRTVSVSNPRVAATDPRAIDATRESLRAAAQGSGLTDILALDLAAALDPGAGSAQITLIAREGICDHLVVTGRCAQEAGEAVVSPASRYRVGDVVSTTDPQLRLSVVGTYRVADVSEPYWAGRLDVDNDPTRADAPVLVTARTLFDARPAVLGVTVDLVALDPAGLAVGPRLTHAVEEIQRATPRGYGVNTGLYGLTGRVEANRRALVSGVVIGTGQLILICVFVLLLAVGHASTERRSEFAVASLRGAPARHRFLLTVGPIAVLLLAAAPIGFGLAWLAARVTAGSGGVAAAGGTPAAYALAGTTVIVALGAAVAGGLRGAPRGRASRGPARRERLSGLELLRRTPGRRRIWRVDVVDLVVMALAAAAA